MELVDDEQDARVSWRTGRPGTTIGPVRSAGSLQVTPKIRNTDQNASVMELVDIGDSKSPALKSVPVRVWPLVPNKKPRLEKGGVFCLVLVVGEIGTPGLTD
jgi:hypothetical protein